MKVHFTLSICYLILKGKEKGESNLRLTRSNVKWTIKLRRKERDKKSKRPAEVVNKVRFIYVEM